MRNQSPIPITKRTYRGEKKKANCQPNQCGGEPGALKRRVGAKETRVMYILAAKKRQKALQIRQERRGVGEEKKTRRPPLVVMGEDKKPPRCE